MNLNNEVSVRDFISNQRKICGVFTIKNTITNKVFVGCSSNIVDKILQYLTPESHYIISEDLRNLGIDYFTVSILKEFTSLKNIEPSLTNSYNYYLYSLCEKGIDLYNRCGKTSILESKGYLEYLNKKFYELSKNNTLNEIQSQYPSLSLQEITDKVKNGESLIKKEQFKTLTNKKSQWNDYPPQRESNKFVLQKGFGDTEECFLFLKKNNLNKNNFIIISVAGEYYIVSLETLANQIVITKNEVFYRVEKFSFFSYFQFVNFKNIYTFPNPRISSLWDNSYLKEMQSHFSDIKVEYTGDNIKGKSYLVENALVLVACLLNNTIR